VVKKFLIKLLKEGVEIWEKYIVAQKKLKKFYDGRLKFLLKKA
jgi:hypothetical protein